MTSPSTPEPPTGTDAGTAPEPDPTSLRETSPGPDRAKATDRWPGELESNVRWQPPVLIASVAAVVMSLLLVRERPPGWLGVLGVVVLLLTGYLAVVWLRARARMAVHGPELTVRRWRDVHTLRAAEVEQVRQRLTGHGPDFVLRTRSGSRVLVPASRLRRGHSSFFEWLLSGGDEGVLDKGSRRTLDLVRQRGLISR